MSFGKINETLNKVLLLLDTKLITKSVRCNDINKLKFEVYKELYDKDNSITLNVISSIFERVFSARYRFNNNIVFDNGLNCFREYETEYIDISVPDKYKPMEKHFLKLLNLPQPAQRSKEWFNYRHNRITASDTASAIDMNPYEPVESFILKKCEPVQFQDNDAVYHGKKYEPIATLVYEHIYNCRMFEFGALPSEDYPFLGASPDGICSKYTLDNKFCKRIGRMLEIKCPVTRYIQMKGEIVGGICPFYYYCQIQQQLLCCNLSKCDFWQCKIIEYKSREEYHTDSLSDTIHKVGTENEDIIVSDLLKKGMILEFYPKNFIPEFKDDNIKWKSKYIYPKRLDMNNEQYNMWVLDIMDQYKSLYPEIDKDYYFNRIVYWKLQVSHNVTIERNETFLDNIIPVLKNTWDQVLYYRRNPSKLDKLKEVIERRKKYVKMNTNINIHNESIINNKLDIMDKNFDMKTFLSGSIPTKTKKVKINPEESDKEEYSSAPKCDFIN
jgi:putative phage-type endonuclease